MPAPLTVPTGQLTSLGVGKETTFGTFATPSIFHACEDVSPTPKNILIPLPASRKRYGQTLPIVAGFEGRMTLTPEADGDTIGQLWAYGMGAQTSPAATYGSTTTTASYSIGVSTIAVVSTLGLQPGSQVGVDTAGQAENLLIASLTLTTITFSSPTTKTHSSGITVAQQATTARGSALTFGALPSFSAESNRGTDTVDYLGCMIDNFSLSIAPGKALQPKFGIFYANEVLQGSPTTPTISTKKPYYAENPNNVALLFGTAYGQAGQCTVQQVDISVANNLAPIRSFPAGRSPVTFAQQQRKASGKTVLGFENDQAYKAFLGNASSATSPQASVPGVSLDFRVFSSDAVDGGGLQYGAEFYLGNVILETHGAPVKSSNYITQEFSFQAAETANGANDDLKIFLITAATTAY